MEEQVRLLLIHVDGKSAQAPVLERIVVGYAVGMIDGLVERSIRRYSGGRESATLYHRAKYAIAGTVGLWLFVFVCLPVPLELQWGSWVAGGVIGVLSRLQWKYYKKYV
jgi:hypothetical protein